MDNKSIIVTDIMRLKSILQYRQYYEKMLFDFINNKQINDNKIHYTFSRSLQL